MRTTCLLFALILLIITGSSCQSVKYTDRGNSGGSFSINNSVNSKHHKRTTVSLLKTGIEETTEKVITPPENDKLVIKPLFFKSTLNGLGYANQKTSQESNAKKIKKETKHKIVHQACLKTDTDYPEEGSIRWFVYLFFCFLIPPLAYYLIKRKTDTMFWVCLLCYLLTSSFLGGFRYGLLGLISIVIALLTLFKINI